MIRTSMLPTIAVAIALTVPVGAATWLSYGSYEPDTALDTPNYMWADAPGDLTKRVYFNVYTTWGNSGANGGWINPNVGAAQTNLDPSGSIDFEAVFGVWTDCNGDGYIGMAETAVREYASQLLLDDTLCPPSSGPALGDWNGANNYRGWVTELIPIANSQASQADARVYRDPAALVWGDPGKPDDPAADAGVVCQGRARGDSRTTGGLLYQADCQGNGVGVIAGVRVPVIQTINDVDEILGLGIGFGDDPADSDSPLNVETFGDDDSSHSAVYLQDCSAEPILVVPDQAPGGDHDGAVLLRPVPTNPTGDLNSATVPGTLNYTAESTYGGPGAQGEGDCDTSNDEGQDFYGFLEGNPDIPAYNGKDAAWDNFRFQTASRGTLPASAVIMGKSGAATDLGITALGIECSASNCFESGWFGDSRAYTTPIVQTRTNLNPDSPADSDISGDVANAPYYTFYASTGPALAALGFQSPGGQGVYGAKQCELSGGEGEFNGWNCDADAWYLRADGTYPAPGGGIGVFARVGQTYNHRDVDCFDGSIGQTGVGASPAFWGPAPCER